MIPRSAGLADRTWDTWLVSATGASAAPLPRGPVRIHAAIIAIAAFRAVFATFLPSSPRKAGSAGENWQRLKTTQYHDPYAAFGREPPKARWRGEALFHRTCTVIRVRWGAYHAAP